MRISAKARYGLAALVHMARYCDKDSNITISSLAAKLDFSKIYLEQVFSLLKRGGIVSSVKGAQGGYSLLRQAKEITVYDILTSIETALFERTEDTVSENDMSIDAALKQTVFDVLDESIKRFLSDISLADVAEAAEGLADDQSFMYYL
ncbi:MAG: Rrf2 family transcriptional regulator [Oscillospiraceae bacterium]|jgi:Rrf2 family protein|nr:Rrf2 family transcriptional regulator [Oscillospiraceae bacterium]